MHDYSIDKHPKEKILFVLVFITVATAPIINDLIKELVVRLSASTGWSMPIVTAIPVFSLFLAIYWLFNKHLWKLQPLRKLLLVPDLNGTWNCQGRTLQKGGAQIDFPWNGLITINQSWSKICIVLETDTSRSHSVAASLFQESTGQFRLIYHYENKPEAYATDLARHDGTTEILFDTKCVRGSGHYYADRNRQTSGTLSINRDRVDE